MMLDSGTTISIRPEADRCAALHGCAYKEALSTEHVELSLDADVLDALYATGEDWEAHFNTILREWLRSNLSVA